MSARRRPSQPRPGHSPRTPQDPVASQKALAIAADFLPVENEALAPVEAGEVQAGDSDDQQAWWR